MLEGEMGKWTVFLCQNFCAKRTNVLKSLCERRSGQAGISRVQEHLRISAHTRPDTNLDTYTQQAFLEYVEAGMAVS